MYGAARAPRHQLVQLALGVVDARDEPLRRRLLDAEAPAQVLLVAGSAPPAPAPISSSRRWTRRLLARPGGAVAVQLEREPPERAGEREVELALGRGVRAQRAEQRAARGALRRRRGRRRRGRTRAGARSRRPAAAPPAAAGGAPRAAAADPDEPLARDRADRLGGQPGGDVGGGARAARRGGRAVAVDLAQQSRRRARATARPRSPPPGSARPRARPRSAPSRRGRSSPAS